jgi:hypothetical protein
MTIHVGWPELIVFGVLVGLSLLTILLRIVRVHGDEVVEFLEWWDKTKTRVKNIGKKGVSG